MVAVIAGNGLGLLGTSLQQLGVGLGGQAGLGQSGASQYVNVATGNLVLQSQDADLVVQGLMAGALRTYNSLGTSGNYGAGGWLLGLDQSLTGHTGSFNTAGSTITRQGSDGETELFTYDTSRGLYVATNKSGAEDTLTVNVTQRTVTYTAGGSLSEEIYGIQGTQFQLVGLKDGKTGASYTLGYGTNGKLLTVTASDGEALELGYDAAGRISTLSTYEIPPGGGAKVTESRISYGYDTSGRLTSVITDLTPDNTSDHNIFKTTYAYDGNSTRIASLTQGDGTNTGLTVSYTYDSSNRVASVTTGSGADAQELTFTYNNGTTTVSDASGQAWVYAYDANGNLTSVTSPLNQVTSYTYTPDGHLASVTDPSNNETIYEYDAHGNLMLQRDADGNTVTWTYNTDDQVLTRTVYRTPDPDGSDPGNAGQASDPSTTWYVYDAGHDGKGNADQLRYVIDADGNVSETQYNLSGQVSVTRSFAGSAYDTTALNPNTAPSLSAMNNWAAAQDLTQTTRVDYAYDASGRLTSKTAWDQVDGTSGNGIADAGESITTYVYDAQGLLRQQVTERGADRTIQDTTSYSYDGMGRLTSSTDAVGNTTTYVYAAGGGTLTVTQANGLLHTEVRNSAGELVTVTESANDGSSSRTTHYYYDEDGQLRATEDPSGAVTYTFYDAAGRISGTVDATGAVTQYTRDADGNVIETRQYATTVSTTGWLTNGSVTSMPSEVTDIVGLTQSSNDRVTVSFYDAAGLHVADVDAEGDVTTYGYDGAGNLITTTQYATALSSGQLNALQEVPSWSTLKSDLASIASAGDRITRTFYDVANRAVAVLDAAGYLTTTAYDAAGRIVTTKAYATGLTSTQLSGLGDTPSLQTILGDIQTNGDPNLDNPDNVVTRNYYDDRGQLIAQVDADGYLTTTTYDETTHTATSTRYAVAITATLTGQETLADLVGDVGTSTSQTSARQYDADGRLSISTAVDGTVTQYGYDPAGNLTSTTTTPPSGAGAVRSTSAQYDVFGDETQAIDGVGAKTTYTYNALGEPILATDALGNNTWSFYDADGRLAYTVKGIANGGTPNALGEVTAYAYDAFGDVTHKTVYATRLDLTSLGLTTDTSLSALATAVQGIANAAVDDTQTYTYTLAGQIATALHGSVQSGSSYVPAYTNAYGYDAFGDLTSVMQQLSGAGQELSTSNSTTTNYTYDARGERTGEADDALGLNRTTGVTYDAFGRVASRTDGNGNVTTYSYDPLGRQVTGSQTVDGMARTTQTAYDAYGRIVTETDALGNVTTYQYSADTHSVTVTTPLGVKLTTTRDAYGDTVSVTDSLNNTTSYTYDGDGRLLTTTDALGNISSDSWDLDGNLLTSTDADGVVTTYTYDAAGRMLSKTLDPTGNNFVTTYTWDGRGQQLSVTDPGLVVTTYAYDADGNVLTMVKAAGELNLTTTYTWDGAGHQLTMLEGAGTSTTRTTQYTYDNLGRLTQTVVDPGDVNKGYLNLITAYAYDGNDNLIVQTDADGNTTYRGYNEANQVEYVVSPAGPATAKQGAVTRNWYDADGHLTATTAYATLVDTSSLGAAPSLTQLAELATASADDRTTYTVYNNDGEVGYTIDAEGYVTLTQYDSNGRETEVLAYANAIPVPDWMQSALRISQAGSYDEITSVVSNAGNTEQNAQATLYLRDNDGQVRFVVKQDTVNGQRLGMVSEQRYDADGRVIASIDYGTPLVLNDSTDWLYDQLSTSSVEQTLAGTTNVHATYYVYSNVGTLSFVIDPDNYVTQNNYDKSGNLTSVHRWLTAITLPATLTTHNVGTAVQAANADDNCQLTVYNYDRASRLIQVQDNLLGVSDLTANAVYTYDALGQKTSYTNRDGDTWTYTYDAAGRLQTETTPQVGVSYYNSPNSPTDNTLTTIYTEIVTEYTYDNDGNVTSSIVGYLNNGNTGGVVGTEATSDTDTEYPFVPMRTMSYVYDRAGHQTEIISPAVSSGNTPPQVDDSGEQEATDPPPVPSEPPPLPGDTTTSSVSYDAFGDAVVNQDINKNYEYKVYNKAGQLAYDIDGDGYVTAYAYDAYGNQTQVTRYATAINFTAISGWSSGQPITIEDIQKSGVLTADANPTDGDRTLTTTYDQLNHKVQVQQSSIACVSPTGTQDGSASPTTVYTYDAYGNVVSTAVLVSPGLTQAPPDNPPVPPTGDASDESTDSDQPLAVWAVTYDYYDALGQKTLEVDPMGYVTTWAYDARGNVTTTTQYAQAATTGWSSTTPPALPAAGTEVTGFDRTTTYTYDAIGRKISETDTGGYSTLSGSTQSIGQQSLLTTWNYVGGGNRVVETTVYGVTPDGATTVTYYDALHRVQQVLQPNRDELLSNWQTTLANSTGEDLTSSNLYGGSAPDTFFSYDVFGDVVSAETSNSIGGDQISYRHYDAMGLVTSETNADGTTYTYTYDFAGNLTSTTYTLTGNSDTSSITTRYNYDANNQRVNSFTDRYSQTTGWVSTDSATYVQYNAFGEIVAKGDGAGLSGVGLYELFYHYDDAGNLISATDPKTGAQHSYQYDLRGDLLYDTTPVTGSSTASVYVENQYDLDGRVTSQTTPSSLSSTAEATRAVTHTYDRWGNVLSTTDANLNKTIYEYDSQNHLIKQIEPKVDVTDQYGNTTTTSTPTKRWSYDLNGNLTGVVDENNYVTTNAYNAAGELISTTDAMGATTYYAYDGLGNQVAKQTLVDDSNQQFTWHITWQSFDALGQVTAEGDFTPSLDGVTRVKNTQQSYLLDENGNRRQVTDALNETSYYSYDSQGRLLSSQTPRQNYYNVSDVFTYDINGNKIGETDANGNTQTWNYDYYSRLQTHVDMSGATYHYSYDQYSGLLTGETSTWDPTNSTQQTSPQSDPGYLPASDKTSGNGLIQSTESYTYYADGQVATVTEKTGAQTTTTTSYQYDAVGNETDQLTATIDGAGGTVDTDTTSSYDSHNRLIDVTETNEVTHAVMMRTDYKYDAAGNRRAVTVHTGYGGTPDQSNWFTYDKDNRVLVSGGDLVGTQILIADRAGSASQTYDDAGDIKSTSTTDGTQTYTQTFTYDVRGEQTGSVLYGGQVETKQYDADGRLIADVYKYAPGTWVPVSTPDQPDGRLFIGGWLESATTYYYDADGDVYATFDYGRKNTDWDAIARQGDYAGQSEIPSSPPSLQDAAGNPPASYGVLAMESHVSHWDPNTGTGGYDAEDNVLVYTYSVANGYTTTYRVNYLKQDGYLEESTTGTSDQPNVLKTTDTSIYDAFGRRIAIDTYSQGQSTHQVRAFAYDANGQILERRDGSAANDTTFSVTNNGGYAIQHYAYVNGQQIGDVDEHGTVDVLSGVTGFSNSDTGTTNYVVQDGDTLQSIAQQIYGDSSLWYVVADANGLTGDGDLVEGQTLKLPQVTTNSNTSTTFKPYNPNEISGSTTPTLPQAPQPAPSGGHSCNTLAEIVVIAVVIVASIYTAGAAAEAFGAADSTAIGTTAVTTTGATFSTGASVLAGSSVAGLSTGAEIAAAAIGGAVGNVAGQLAGDALGVHQGFSLGEALAGGLTAGATAGIGGAISSDSALLSANGGLTAEGYALEGAADYGAGVAANKLVGQPQTFSWANLVASAVGSTLTGEAHLPTNTQLAQGESSGNFFEDLGGSLVNGAIDSETARLLGGNAANGNQIAIDAFGNALGNAAIAGIRTENARSQAQQQAQLEATTQQMQSSFSNELQGDIDAQTGQYIQSQMDAASTADFALMDAERGNVVNGITGNVANDYELGAPGKPSQGYPVPAGYTNDPAIIKALYQNTLAYVGYENQQANAGLPPVPGDPDALVDYNHALQQGLYPQNSMQTLDAVNVVATSENVAAASMVPTEKGGFWGGVGHALFETVYQPLAMTYDLEQTGYEFARSVVTGEAPRDIDYASALGEFAAGGAGTGDILIGGVKGAVMTPVRLGYAIGQGNAYAAGEELTNLGLLLGGGVGGADSAITARMGSMLSRDLAKQAFVYRAIPEDLLQVYMDQGSISGPFGKPTYFSLEGGATPIEHKIGAQLENTPEVLLKIPVSALETPTVPRPDFGTAWFGREYTVSSYPELGAGGYRQFTATTNTFSEDWIVKGWGKR